MKVLLLSIWKEKDGERTFGLNSKYHSYLCNVVCMASYFRNMVMRKIFIFLSPSIVGFKFIHKKYIHDKSNFFFIFSKVMLHQRGFLLEKYSWQNNKNLRFRTQFIIIQNNFIKFNLTQFTNYRINSYLREREREMR